MNHVVPTLRSVANNLRRVTVNLGPSTPAALSCAPALLDELAATLDAAPGAVPLDTLARFIRETAPAEHLRLSGKNVNQGWAAGCDAARDRIAHAIADASDLRPSERAAFLAACGVSS